MEKPQLTDKQIHSMIEKLRLKIALRVKARETLAKIRERIR